MPSTQLKLLIEAIAPLFAGEAEVFSTYWTSPMRTKETDRLWLMRQARKEVWDTPLGDQRGLYLGPAEDLIADFPRIDIEIPREEILERMEGLYEEFSHYCAYADAYDAVRTEGEPRLSPTRLKDVPDWPENMAIRDRRAEIRRQHGTVGERACYFTEGGYCTLFSEGMKLAGNGGRRADREGGIARLRGRIRSHVQGDRRSGPRGHVGRRLGADDRPFSGTGGNAHRHAQCSVQLSVAGRADCGDQGR